MKKHKGGDYSKMKKIAGGLVALVFLTSSGVAVCAAGKADADAKALFNRKCGICHSLNRPKSKKMSADEWKSTVMRMKNTNGAPVSDEEAKTIIDYLSEHFAK
jgi:cytochrome c5